MANIGVERRERSAWQWVAAGLVLLALLVWYLVARDRGQDRRAAAGAAAGAPAAAVPTAVGDYLRFAADRRAEAEASHEHDYTAAGLRGLAAAIGEIGGGDTAAAPGVRALADTVRMRADDLQRNPRSTEHARYAREGFTAAADALAAVQERRFPALAGEIRELRAAAAGVEPGRLLLEQRAAVQLFFDRAATALRAMTAATA